jgi:hypothetical protein
MAQNEKEVVLIEKYIKNKSREFTINDAASVTGLPLIETEDAVKNLMEKYDCKLKVTEGGDLVYDFGTLHRRTAKSFGEYFQEFLQMLWKGFTIFYKVMISLFLVIYFVVFLLLVIALILGLFSQGNNDNGSKGAGKLIGFVFRLFWSIFEWSTILGYNNMYRRHDRYGYGYRHYVEKPGVLAPLRKKAKDSKSKKSFVASVYDFVFGPPRVEIDPLENEQEVATFLRENKGLVCTSELQALAGWTRDEAENFMTEVLARFDGKAQISPNAVLYGDFSEFIRSKDRKGEADVVYYWDEYEPEYEMTGNKGGRDWGVGAMNAFNLILSAMVLWGPLFELFDGDPVILLLLGWIPFIYSATFFLIPMLRWIRIQPLRKAQHKMNIRKRLMKAIFEEHKEEMTLKRLTQIANEKATTEEKLSEKVVEDLMMEVIRDLGGDSYVDSAGQIRYKFERLDREMDEIKELRAEKRDDEDLGKIIFEA